MAADRHAVPRDHLDKSDHLRKADFDRLAVLIEERTGIRLPPAKALMLEGRLRKRVALLGLPGLEHYCRFLFEQGGLAEELPHLIDAVTTNKTDFYREPAHFAFLADRAVPEMLAGGLAGRPLQVWSAASSSGPEPYTLAFVLSDLARIRTELDFVVHGTDISVEILREAERAIYGRDMIEPIPLEVRKRYLLRSRERPDGEFRIAPEIRRHVRFARLNLLDARYPWDRPMDMIFCRNVLIYFSRQTQLAVLQKLCACLRRGGFLFLGHSETLAGMPLPVANVAPAVYQRL
ncbi:protein-glutamate O-methyltransferase CheR [Telmatospirillum sp. J64-1]|uniref:CheR family methyltransferase n=1 Tax=Telmatospirillum sp. J64-1 TaxID=2502183 RepID=UPI00115E9DF8|nr:CheR family methyltransferase [Telmatospirillum sp. J64-1]